MIAFNLVGTDKNSGTKTYNINFLKQINSNFLDEDLIVYVPKSYADNIELNSNNKITYKIKSNLLNNFILRFFWLQIWFPLELKNNKVTTLFSACNYSPILIKILNIRSVLFIHSVIPWQYLNLLPGSKFKNILIKKMMEISIQNADHIIVPSYYAKKVLFEKFNKHKIKVTTIYLGADHIIEKIKNKNKINNFDYTSRYILSVLSCVKYHNILNLLKAYKKFINENNLEINYVIINNILDKSYFKVLNNFVENNFDKGRVIFLSNIDNEYLPNIYKNSLIYLFSSYSETFGFSTLEAMNYNIPLLVSKTSALEEINGNFAEYFNPDDVDEIKNKIAKIFKDTEHSKNKEIFFKKRNETQLKKFLWKENYLQTIKILRNDN